MHVSVIVTVINEQAAIGRLLESLHRQTHRPDEIVICDGGSSDGTQAVIAAYAAAHHAVLPPLRLIDAPGANISQGRNTAIRAAAGPLIAVTDVGVRLEESWLERLLAPFAAVDQPAAVAGFFLPDAQGLFQTALAATVLPLLEDIDPERFLPSSRSVAFTKRAWEAAGGYPEWLDYCEDLLFDFAINAQQPERATGFAWAPDALVHWRPRSSLRAFAKQYYLYARGDGKADLWRKRHAARYVTYLLLAPGLIAFALSAPAGRWLGWMMLAAGLALYCRRPWQRLETLGRSLSPVERLWAALLVPLIRGVGDVAKMAGYPVGLLWRWRNRHNPVVHWRARLPAPNLREAAQDARPRP